MAAAALGCRGLLFVRSWAVGSVSFRAFSVRKEPELEENPFYGKYRDKIQQLRRADPVAYGARLEKRKEVHKQPVGSSTQSEYMQSLKVKSDSVKEGFTRNKTLNSLLDVERVKDKSAEDIAQLWKQFFAAQDTVFAVIPGDTFDLIWRRSQCCPSFLYALPRNEGYEFFVGQWSGLELHFTSLLNIQTAGDSAPSQLILHHYKELQLDKGIILMMGECDFKFLNIREAHCLANQVQLFYAGDEFGLVETFNHNPSDFKYMAVISLLEKNRMGKTSSDS